MIKIDNRVGSVELADLFKGVPTEITRLEYADFAFTGNGPDDMPYLIGIERKEISDLVQSMDSGRLSGHQLVGLTNSYNTVYLLIEGQWKPREDGVLLLGKGKNWFPMEFGKRRYTYHEVTNFLNSLQIMCGINVFQTVNKRISAMWIKHLFFWWQKSWDKHKSHLMFNQSVEKQYAQLYEPPFVQRVIKELKGVGWDRSRALAARFKTVENLLLAAPGDLREVEGIGKKLSEQIYAELRGEK